MSPAELVGLLLGLHLISTEHRSRTTCAIGIDNQAVFGTLQSDLRNPGQHLAREIIKVGNRMQKERKRSAFTLTIRWVAGHEGIEGNEMADRAAKEAAGGAHTDKHHLPSYLRKRIPINPSALKQDIKVRLSNKWKKDWRSSERGKEMAKLDGTTPSAKFLESISHPEISRSTASTIAQLRLTHVPVNEYLYRFKRVDSARCPACGEDTEDITHFLLSCPGYAHERWALARKAAKLSKPFNLATLLGVPTMALPLAEFLESTQRFENKTKRAE